MNSTTSEIDRAAIVLVGGRSSRFGSNKALHRLGGKALLCHIVETLLRVTAHVVVVAGREEDPAQYRQVIPASIHVVNDLYDGKSPLVGIATGLQEVDSELVAILSCDIPLVSAKVVDFMYQRARDADAAIPKWNGGPIEPLLAVYRKAPTLKSALETLAVPNLSIRDMIGRLSRVLYVSIEDEVTELDPRLYTFLNANTREDMAEVERAFLKQSMGELSGHEDNHSSGTK